MSELFIGLDVGGTKLEAVLVEKTSINCVTLLKLRANTERGQGYEHIIFNISKLIQDLLTSAQIDLKKIKAIGLGLPGTIDPKSNLMLLGNTRVLEHKPILTDLKKQLTLAPPIFAENDANAFALAEVYLGAGLEYKKLMNQSCETQNAVGIILGTGVGGGIIINGKIMSGRRGSGGEIGHTTLHTNGVGCYCDRKGCAEQYLSGTAVEDQYKTETNKTLSSQEIFTQKDETSKNIVHTYKKNLSQLLGNIANVLDPDYFVLGGGVSLQPAIYENLQNEVQKNLFVKSKPPQIFKHQVSDSSGSIGAALVAWKQSS